MTNILYIGNKLSAHGNNATSIETLGKFLERENYKLFYASSKKNKILRIFHMVYMTLKHSKKVDYVLIDTYSTSNFWYTVVISQLSRILKLKYIPNLRGGDLPNRLKNNPYLCNLIFKNALVNVAPSTYLFEAFQCHGFTNLVYIPNTIEIENYHFINRSFDCPRILWVRAFSEIYNPMLAVKVFIEIKKEYPNATLCMVGPKKDDSYDKTVKIAKENNLEVTFTGRLAKSEWINLSSNYNVFLNTTHFDNTPISVMEAMALGLPIVSTNVGGIPHLLEHDVTALLVNDNDLSDMVVQINRIVNEQTLRNNLIANSRKNAETFDWNIVKKQWKSLLR